MTQEDLIAVLRLNDVLYHAFLAAVCRYALVEQPEPPRAAGANTSAPNTAVPGSNTTGTGPNNSDGGAVPASPGLARSPPIDGGSSMPGGFPGGFPFSLFGFGGGGRGSSSSGGGGRHTSEGQQQSSGGTSSSANDDHHNRQGQPDMDLDLD